MAAIRRNLDEPRHFAYGHGTTNAVDEAAYLILATLDLPIEDINPWLDCLLTLAEREAVNAVISRRIETRKPAAYITNAAYIQGHKFYVDERVIVPRSFIGELLVQDHLGTIVPAPLAVRRVLDLCTGSGCLAILAALAFPNAEIDASDISEDALAVARRNIADYGLRRASALSRRICSRGFSLRSTISLSQTRPTLRRRRSPRFHPNIGLSRRLRILAASTG